LETFETHRVGSLTRHLLVLPPKTFELEELYTKINFSKISLSYFLWSLGRKVSRKLLKSCTW